MRQQRIGRPGRTALWTGLILSSFAFGQTQSNWTYTYTGVPIPIPTQSSGIGVNIPITIPQPIYIQNVNVTVNIDYPTVGDLNVYLFNPQGTRTILLERDCGSQGTLNNITFSDAATTLYSDFCPAESGGSWKGNEPLGNFNNEYAIGLWTLFVQNNGSDTTAGWVVSYSIAITGIGYPSPASTSALKLRSAETTAPIFVRETVVNAATLRNGAIAAGEIISIFGIQLGPKPAAVVAEGNLPTTLGDVSVTIGGVAAPLKYVSYYRVDAQVPNSIAPGALAPIEVTFKGATSKAVEVPVTTAAPGIHTLSPAGVGQAVALNSDGTANSESARASLGSQVRIRVGGLGVTNPEVPDGQAPPTPGPPVFNAVTASVDGVPATVASAALVPGSPGVYEVTLTVPAGIRTGAVPVLVSTASGASQEGTLLHVQ